MDASALAAKAFEDVHSCLAIHKTEAADKVKGTVVSLLWRELFCAHVPSVFEVEAFEIDFLKSRLDLLNHVR